MTARRESQEPISQTEIAAQDATELPEHDALSLLDVNLGLPINLGAALNVLSDGSEAAAAAQQHVPIEQTVGGVAGSENLPIEGSSTEWGPINEQIASNVDSPGSITSAAAVQEAPTTEWQ